MAKVNADLPDAPQANVKRAVPAVSDMGIFHAEDEGSKFRLCKPHRDLPPEHAWLERFGVVAARRRSSRCSLSGHHEHDSGAVGLRPAQETQKCRVRSFLRETVEIEPGIDRLAAAGDTLLEPPAEWRERRWFFRCGRVAAHGQG